MLTLMSTSPVGGIIAFPALGAFLGWFLAAAVVGMGLHFLSVASKSIQTGEATKVPLVVASRPEKSVAHVDTHDHPHRVAA